MNKNDIARSFSLAAKTYDHHAFVQQEIGHRLIERLDYIKQTPRLILDVGSGTGHLTRILQQKFPDSMVLGLDIAQGMAQFAKSKQSWQFWKNNPHYLCADAESLPFANASIDFIFSNFTLQWCANLSQTFAEFKRVLKPEGMIFFSTLGPQTLHELKSSFAAVDNKTHVNEFVDMHDIGDHLLNLRFSDPVIDMEMLTIEYPDVNTLLTDLKGTGAHNMNVDRPEGCISKHMFQRMIEAYSHFKQPNGCIPASYEIIYGHAWQQQPSHLYSEDKDGFIRIPANKIPRLEI
ncbi:malonyl-ACP O-methyltransferase BioC [Candidatus Berkiella aquae]|uniref:Malonyl-[acyl-carrier protein] O-methyltransferase n=1 Tax=Candidatus Berkiella aquae TaxID=295108 RepID=A0A0Q9YFR6_9GAMM|nr:malonyl-ACP O-methyltransferase BioC [Candidatus Berkiella aquae]MCS5709825.1 malonyl-ACP O-methyltransferase BioC [Candidatus Berkiella aquae]